MPIRTIIRLVILPALFAAGFANSGLASPLNAWRVSCGADPGAITRNGGDWIFKTSRNHCPGGIFKQRAELSTQKVPPTHRGAYVFRTTIAFESRSREKFSLFQIHDGRLGCAPPLKLDVLPGGQLQIISDVKTGPGES